MKHCTFPRLMLVALLLLATLCASPSIAVAPNPDGYTTVSLRQGWWNNEPTWYIGTATNDIRFAQTQGLVLAPKLTQALGNAAPIYIVTNFQQPYVFSASPTGGPINYSGLWRVVYITWLAGSTPRPITNALPESGLNPNGIPVSGISQVVTDIVLDYPILVIGQLGCPLYTIPQLVSLNYTTKTAVLPFFNAYCANVITRRVSVVRTLITDVEYAPVAALVGANFAPGLNLLPNPGVQLTWMFTPYPVPGWQMSPPSQYPIIWACPTSFDWRNANYAYSPVSNVYFLTRITASPSSVINNAQTVMMLVANGALVQTPITTVNGGVIPSN